jgi:hypothetical protein
MNLFFLENCFGMQRIVIYDRTGKSVLTEVSKRYSYVRIDNAKLKGDDKVIIINYNSIYSDIEMNSINDIDGVTFKIDDKKEIKLCWIYKDVCDYSPIPVRLNDISSSGYVMIVDSSRKPALHFYLLPITNARTTEIHDKEQNRQIAEQLLPADDVWNRL